MIELTLDLAERAARAALEKARAIGTPMTISVVDESGRLVLTMKGDGTGFFTTDTSRAKACASVAFKKPTIEIVEFMKTQHGVFFNLVPAISKGELLPTTGGYPISLGGKVIGAIGCGGGTAEQDHECAKAGAEAVAA